MSLRDAGRLFSFDELGRADLIVDATYEGGSRGGIGDDPLAKLLPVGNLGGFRYHGSPRRAGECKLAVLFSHGASPDWPDVIDQETGRCVYYGDNRQPGPLHDTTRGGNELLRNTFDALHAAPPRRDEVPPFFVFTKGDRGRDVVFRGLAAPGSPGVSPGEDLVAVWKTAKARRFQNYRSIFTILDVAEVARTWIDDLIAGNRHSPEQPRAWRQWVGSGRYKPLRAPRVLQHRTPDEQAPTSAEDLRIVDAIRRRFAANPHGFERCAAEIWRMQSPAVSEYRVTQRSVDGGRDVIGLYALGPQSDPIHIDFALEAKCYAADNPVGVREASRLISRLRHRQFGVLVTTSFLNRQAYKEIREDGHPVVVIAAADIVAILKRNGIASSREAQTWLDREFPPEADEILGVGE